MELCELVSPDGMVLTRKDRLQPPQQTILSRPCPKVIDQEGRHKISFFDDATRSILKILCFMVINCAKCLDTLLPSPSGQSDLSWLLVKTAVGTGKSDFR